VDALEAIEVCVPQPRQPFTALKRLSSSSDPERIKAVGRDRSKNALAGSIVEADQLYQDTLKKAIVEDRRVDLLATHILGYDCRKHHRQMLAFQEQHPQSLCLAYRGSGKSTIGTVAKIIWYLCVNPNLRIVIVSMTTGHATALLREVKQQLSANDALIEMFGEFAPRSLNDPNIVWNNDEINIRQRVDYTKESNITAVGAGAAVVGKHYDVAVIDDLVDEDHSHTAPQREKIKTFYYKTLDPCIEPPDPAVPFRGERRIIGTRYHPDDLFGHLLEHEMKEHTQIIPALTVIGEDDLGHPIYETPWPEKFSVKFLLEQRATKGPSIFDSQYQCDINTMRGDVFSGEWFEHDQIFYDKPPESAVLWSGVDLAIGLRERNDKFAHVTIARDLKTGIIYLVDYIQGRYGFNQQTAIIGERFMSQQPVRVGIEAVAYQAAQFHQVVSQYPDMKGRAVPVFTKVDKLTRAWRLTGLFESKMVRLKVNHTEFINHMVAFRGDGSGEDDLFDAFEIAVNMSQRGARKQRENEPGLH
jgi:phage terminase large subunit-like protein